MCMLVMVIYTVKKAYGSMHKQLRKRSPFEKPKKNSVDKLHIIVCLQNIVEHNKNVTLLNKKSVHLYIAVRHEDHLVYEFCTILM